MSVGMKLILVYWQSMLHSRTGGSS